MDGYKIINNKDYDQHKLKQDIKFIKEIVDDIKNNKISECYTSKQEMLDDLRGLVESVAEEWGANESQA